MLPAASWSAVSLFFREENIIIGKALFWWWWTGTNSQSSTSAVLPWLQCKLGKHWTYTGSTNMKNPLHWTCWEETKNGDRLANDEGSIPQQNLLWTFLVLIIWLVEGKDCRSCPGWTGPEEPTSPNPLMQGKRNQRMTQLVTHSVGRRSRGRIGNSFDMRQRHPARKNLCFLNATKFAPIMTVPLYFLQLNWYLYY